MEIKILVRLALLLTAVSVTTAIITCQDPTPHVGKWVIGVNKKKDSVSLVKKNCPGVKPVTDEWKRGRKVRSDCENIPKWTAIATFFGAGRKYKGHAAIFESCDKDGIWVYDQWKAEKVDRRKMKYNSKQPNYNGNNFYAIE